MINVAVKEITDLSELDQFAGDYVESPPGLVRLAQREIDKGEIIRVRHPFRIVGKDWSCETWFLDKELHAMASTLKNVLR